MLFTVFQSSSRDLFKSYTAPHPDGRCVLLTIGFATNRWNLNAAQRLLLGHSIPRINLPSTVLEMYARTDRTGSAGTNMVVGLQRLCSVQDDLVKQGADATKVLVASPCKVLGEQFEAFYGVPDGQAYAGGRVVHLFLWSSQAAYTQGPSNREFRDLVGYARSFSGGFAPTGSP